MFCMYFFQLFAAWFAWYPNLGHMRAKRSVLSSRRHSARLQNPSHCRSTPKLATNPMMQSDSDHAELPTSVNLPAASPPHPALSSSKLATTQNPGCKHQHARSPSRPPPRGPRQGRSAAHPALVAPRVGRHERDTQRRASSCYRATGRFYWRQAAERAAECFGPEFGGDQERGGCERGFGRGGWEGAGLHCLECWWVTYLSILLGVCVKVWLTDVGMDQGLVGRVALRGYVFPWCLSFIP